MRISPPGLLVTVLGAAVLVATTNTPSDSETNGQTASGGAANETQVVRYQPRGAEASCSFDACGLGDSDPINVVTPPVGTTCVAVVTASFRYRTVGAGKFGIAASLGRVGKRTEGATPGIRRLLPTHDRLQSSTVQFLARDLHPATAFALKFSASLERRSTGSAFIAVTQLLTTVNARCR